MPRETGDPFQPERDEFAINGTRAGNPGAMRFNPFRYYWLNPVGPALIFALTALLVVPAVFFPFLFVLPVLVLLLAARHLKSLWQQFYYGDVNGGIVVSERPCLVAVYTDLTQGTQAFPVVKVVEEPLERALGHTPPVRTRVATVSFYSGQLNGRKWDDFWPITVNLGTGSRAVLRRALESIPQGQWEFLELVIRLLPYPFEPGLYKVFLKNDGTPAEVRRDVRVDGPYLVG